MTAPERCGCRARVASHEEGSQIVYCPTHANALAAAAANAEVFKAWAKDYKAQRDVLLAALREIAGGYDEWVRTGNARWNAADIARAAIAKAEGES